MADTLPDEAAASGFDFDSEMDRLACEIAAKAREPDIILDEKIKALVALQPYYAARQKYKEAERGSQRKPEKKSGGQSFRGFKEKTGSEK